MLQFLQENLATILVSLALLAALILILRKLIRAKTTGQGSCACGCNCGACQGGPCSAVSKESKQPGKPEQQQN